MEIKEILRRSGLRYTRCREAVLHTFSRADHALAHSDIEENLKEFDRVTLYRTLSSFLEKGLIHKVPDDSGQAKFALCSMDCSSHRHNDDHVHFKCLKCNTSECLMEMPIPSLQMPKGYKISEAKLMIEGICEACA